MSDKTGGPAFPWGEHGTHLGGMTLRDYFAAKFSAAWVVALAARHQEPGYTDTDALHEANRRGLEQADAMIAARKESGNG